MTELKELPDRVPAMEATSVITLPPVIVKATVRVVWPGALNWRVYAPVAENWMEP